MDNQIYKLCLDEKNLNMIATNLYKSYGISSNYHDQLVRMLHKILYDLLKRENCNVGKNDIEYVRKLVKKVNKGCLELAVKIITHKYPEMIISKERSAIERDSYIHGSRKVPYNDRLPKIGRMKNKERQQSSARHNLGPDSILETPKTQKNMGNYARWDDDNLITNIQPRPQDLAKINNFGGTQFGFMSHSSNKASNEYMPNMSVMGGSQMPPQQPMLQQPMPQQQFNINPQFSSYNAPNQQFSNYDQQQQSYQNNDVDPYYQNILGNNQYDNNTMYNQQNNMYGQQKQNSRMSEKQLELEYAINQYSDERSRLDQELGARFGGMVNGQPPPEPNFAVC